jgi:hypothetical protein
MPCSKKIFTALLLVSAFFVHTSFAAEEETKTAPAQKAPPSPLETYRETLAKGEPQPAEFFYNLGTLALQANSTGEAFALLSKASYLAPLSSDIRHNLRLAREKLSPTASQSRPASWIGWWPATLRALPWQFFLLVSLLALAPLQWFLADKKFSAQSWHGTAAAVSLLFALIAGGNFWQNRTPMAGTLRAAKLLSGPATSFPEISNLEAGSLVNAEEERDGWHKVRFVGIAGETVVGWLNDKDLLIF